ncbi:MAG: DUF2993 domain-containing protein [Jaaginema sp. PMC 1079.18]|nr:DUF2993 domain-containing protein [Jaaginema sp. PMC 1080.18]MEC4851315.1 DUF2993 domain-containing protein [Jaaginema sp. PMC 1079.18]MEC4868137.1 DUF2993 domain-containing protein [Jaaginema sp. PMC 1078.18]
MTVKSPGQIISQVLSPAVRLWLRSQVDAIAELEFQINGKNRQILRGYIPNVVLSAAKAVYQGLHFTRVQLQANNIRVNLGQVIKGQSLRLLEPIPVTGEVSLSQADLQASLSSPLLSTAIKDLLSTLMAASGKTQPQPSIQDWQLHWQEAVIAPNCLKLKGIVTNVDKNTIPIVLETQLNLANAHCLCLRHTEITASPLLNPVQLEQFDIDLGEAVNLDTLQLQSGEILVSGGVRVMP